MTTSVAGDDVADLPIRWLDVAVVGVSAAAAVLIGTLGEAAPPS